MLINALIKAKSTPPPPKWGITGMSLVQSVTLTNNATPRGVYISRDGSRMYIMHRQSNQQLSQYDLTTPWDISTRSLVRTTTITYDASGHDIYFSPDGSDYYWGGTSTDRIGQFNMSSAWDISTASASTPSKSTSILDNPLGWAFNQNGTLLVVGANSLSLSDWRLYSVSTPWDISTATSVLASVASAPFTGNGATIGGDNSEYLYFGGGTGITNLHRCTYSGGSISIDQTVTVSSEFGAGIFIDPVMGNYLWNVNSSNNTLNQYALT